MAQQFHPEKKPIFMDYQAWDDMDFCERKQIHMELALGMSSEENQLQRQQVINQTQTQLYTQVQQMAQAGTLNPAMYAKIKRPFADTLYVLGVKDADTYLPTEEEVVAMIEQAAEAAKNREPDPAAKKDLSSAELNTAKTEQIRAEMTGQDAETQLDYMAVASGDPKVYQ